MARIEPLNREFLDEDKRAAFDAGMVRWGRMTNMKRTLLHSMPAYKVLMEWYTMLDAIKPFLGERLSVVFAHAISSGSDCLICTTFMRRLLIDTGENPNALELDERGAALVEFGRAVARQGNRVPAESYQRIASHFTAEQIVALTAFAGMMIATNVINNVLEVDLDEYLYAYRDGTAVKHGA